MRMSKEVLNEYIEFLKQIELDENGYPNNTEFFKSGYGWEPTYETHCFTIAGFQNGSYRIKPKPIMRPMDFREAERLLGLKLKHKFIAIFLTIIEVGEEGVFTKRGALTFKELHKLYNDINGNKLEVEDGY